MWVTISSAKIVQCNETGAVGIMIKDKVIPCNAAGQGDTSGSSIATKDYVDSLILGAIEEEY